MYIYFDWVSAILAHGKPSGPRLRNHSIVTIKNGKIYSLNNPNPLFKTIDLSVSEVIKNYDKIIFDS